MYFKALLASPEYRFLQENPRLGNRIMLLGVSGSYGYGTSREGSDIDLRGATLNLASDLIGLTSFEQYEDEGTDTVVYSFNKLIGLLLRCNPNVIEILGLDENQYLICSEFGKELLDKREMFLSKRAAASFGHYADAQLRRLQNAVARDALPQPAREQHIMKSVMHALEDYNRRHMDSDSERMKLYVDDAVTSGFKKEIFVDAEFRHYPLRTFNELSGTLNSVVRDYDTIGKRDHKKDENHLNKHAMHLVRLFMMGIDILERGEINTHRAGEDLKLLISIRNGDFTKQGILVPEFYDIVSEYEEKFEEAAEHTTLPDEPDPVQVEEFVEYVNRHVVEEAQG